MKKWWTSAESDIAKESTKIVTGTADILSGKYKCPSGYSYNPLYSFNDKGICEKTTGMDQDCKEVWKLTPWESREHYGCGFADLGTCYYDSCTGGSSWKDETCKKKGTTCGPWYCSSGTDNLVGGCLHETTMVET